jgi:hypothetical protein
MINKHLMIIESSGNGRRLFRTRTCGRKTGGDGRREQSLVVRDERV